jgi:hypothetical protein
MLSRKCIKCKWKNLINIVPYIGRTVPQINPGTTENRSMVMLFDSLLPIDKQYLISTSAHSLNAEFLKRIRLPKYKSLNYGAVYKLTFNLLASMTKAGNLESGADDLVSEFNGTLLQPVHGKPG